eukprot:gene10798-22543_t
MSSIKNRACFTIFNKSIGLTYKPINCGYKLFSTSPMEATAVNTTPNFTTVPNHLALALKPKDVVDQLDKFIVGQADAKRAVAIALRNRWRRHQLSDDLKAEVIPKNILMIGPTGCGKTEIARRIAKLSQAPFIKVEATKYTEVGFHGRDVDQIIRDLLDISISMTKKRIREEIKQEVELHTEERLLEALVGTNTEEKNKWITMLREGALEDRHIEIDVPPRPPSGDKSGGPFSGMLDPNNPIMGIFDIGKGSFNIGDMKPKRSDRRNSRRKVTVAEARPLIYDDEEDRLMENRDVNKEAILSVEESGIVFIDEIDKLVSSSDYRGADASSEGVQRDLLPIIEGSTVNTKHGNVNTDFILFICSGAFHSSKPSDLLAELQGRLPIRVNLKGLTEQDLQQQEMLKAENVDLRFTDDAIREIAAVAFQVNTTVENIGARRLHTVIERIVEEVSFDAPDRAGTVFEVSVDYVKTRVGTL